MGKKARLKAIKNLANNLPVIIQNSVEKHEMLGSKILEWGTIKEIDGKPIDPNKKYIFNYPVQMVQNSRRKMKKAFIKHGEAGIKHMLDEVLHTVANDKS